MNGSLYITDPNGENLQPQGCLHGMWIMAVAVAITIALCLLFPACKTQQPAVTETNTNTLIEREQLDSLIKVAGKKCTIFKKKVHIL